MEAYESKGEIYFSNVERARYRQRIVHLCQSVLGCSKLPFSSWLHRKWREATWKGPFACPSLKDLSKSWIFLKDISGKLNDQPFTANFSIQNFEDPIVSLDFKGGVEAAPYEFLSRGAYQPIDRRMDADVSFDGRFLC